MFKINIANREVFTLFDTGASRSVMSGETFRKLNLGSKNLDTKNLPTVVGANGTSLGAIGKINCKIEIGKKKFKQNFLVCENLTRSLILGVDFAKQHAAGVHWTKHNSFVLTIITKSISLWASPVVIVPKKSAPGEPPQRRMCVDFRRLNKQLPEVKNMSGGKGCISLVPLPKIDELYAKLQGYKVFSTLDLRSGYYHIGLSDSAKPKSAFVVSGMGKFEFNRLPFGLAQVPAYFQRLINEVLTDCYFAMGYLDDIIIFSKTEEEHYST